MRSRRWNSIFDLRFAGCGPLFERSFICAGPRTIPPVRLQLHWESPLPQLNQG